MHTRSPQSARWHLTVLLGATLGACLTWGVPRDEGTACRKNDDCRPGEVCVEGRCQSVCDDDDDCPRPGAICAAGTCRVPSSERCGDAYDCIFPGPCETVDGARCEASRCVYPLLPVDTACVDDDPCTVDEMCDADGVCGGPERLCDAPPAASCNAANDEMTAYPATGRCVDPTGECSYTATTVPCSPCSDCLSECEGVSCPDQEGGCQIEGTCIGGAPAECRYSDADEGVPCDLPGDAAGSLAGVCDGGLCVGCIDISDCVRPPSGVLACYDVACNGGVCEYLVRGGGDCDDGDACTYDDVCGLDGACGGTAITCTDDPEPCGARRTCDGTDTCAVTHPTAGSSCDDGQACTYDDQCDGAGTCTGTSITCNDSAGTCGANRSCNGTSSCTVTYPGSGTSCNDNDACTYNDRCNGSGGCSGTTITCNDGSGVCGINRSCNGTSSCSESYPGTGTTCNDGNACTTGDHCNGSGACVGGSNRPNGHQWGSYAKQRCCGGQQRDISTDESNCGGCGTVCTSGFVCEPVENTTCTSGVTHTSGRCTCNYSNGNADCPRGQYCRNSGWSNGNRCGPPGDAYCSSGQSQVEVTNCPDYCVY